MINIPLGKALAVVESDDCYRCCFYDITPIGNFCTLSRKYQCRRFNRKDGKNIIYKLIDYPVEEEK